MLMLVRSIVSRLVCRFRSRAFVELENLALNNQLHVLCRQRDCAAHRASAAGGAKTASCSSEQTELSC